MNSFLDDDIDNFNIFKLIEEECYPLFELVLEHLEIYNFHIDSKNENGNTLLHLVSSKGVSYFAEKLINLGSDVNVTNKTKETPLHLACSSGNLSVVKLLVKNNARLNIKDIEGENPIFKAAKHGHLNIIQYLKINPEHFREVNNKQENLMHTAVKSSNVMMVDYLNNIGKFDINSPTLEGSTPLHLALGLKRNCINMIKELLKNGADPHVKDEKLRNLLHLSIVKRNLQACRLLIDHRINVNEQDCNGSSPLHIAVELQLQNIAFLLVHNKADVNKQDLDGYTPLHLASRTNCDLVKFLLRNRALYNLKTFNGDSPLHLAASSGNFEAVVVLLNGGFRANNLNNDNYSPVQLAEINGHGKVLKLLLEHYGNSASFEQLSKIPRAVRKANEVRMNLSRNTIFNLPMIGATM